MKTQARFITVEGGEGAGKTTQLVFMQNYLEAHGQTVLLTREPGGTDLGEELRTLVLRSRQPVMAVETELLLLFAARAEHLQQVIQPALAAGTWVLCDRFTDATYAYQGGGRGIPWERIAVLEHWLTQSRSPDLTLLFDLPVTVGLQRTRLRARLDRFEREDRLFFERVRQAYQTLAQHNQERYRVIDASRSIEQVKIEVETHLNQLLRNGDG
ncbi:MAG: dTMP kinase [Candidatus Competibacteraceae bacterium]|nr:dTMP kinase [Candidatus Competibacteraceae bacterium]